MNIEEINRQELVKQLNSILDEMEAPLGKIIHLIMNYADSHDRIDLYGIDGGETERRLDGLGSTNGWVIDRLMHRTYNERGSVTRKINKAQGYNL